MSMPYVHISGASKRHAKARRDALVSLDIIQRELRKLRLIANEYGERYPHHIISPEHLTVCESYTELMAEKALKHKP